MGSRTAIGPRDKRRRIVYTIAMRQQRLPVIANERLRPALYRLALGAPGWTVSPGQFLHVLCRDPEAHTPFLRRALPVHRFGADQVELLVRPAEPGHAWLARRRPEELLDVIGPLGRGFALPATPGHLLLLGHALGIAPLVGLADQALAQGWAVTLLTTATRPADAYPAALLPPLVEYHVVPAEAGPLAPLSPAVLLWADLLVAAVPGTAWPDLRQRIEAARGGLTPGFAQVWADVPIACGQGRCQGCALETRQGWRLVCSDGPVFDLVEVTG